ncbi:60S ribosome subunit biogenesis protein NIP7 [Talaromyces proteolyticus]|uniref:60S ribosome subunit biogenesis protein NIP7 n=1 Tax=Talaromyces proteolyticus TaxID=1131652 RepID=A0AAD4KF66_9EURO|nr:60S ribosome subunit biogenesis protein NIP7 [Talaromyces proteolyticus]KAH8690194.1 60S ribosome subunit biogenesis protein NIP7 [Talaromyces proteolyticus]
MRSLTEQELRSVLEKLTVYVSSSVKELLTNLDGASSKPDRYVFRLSQGRVYYLRLSLANLATSISRDNLLACGTCLGRFTKSGKFRLHITALSIIAPLARHKVFLRSNGVMPFLYGGHVAKAHTQRWPQDCHEYDGMIVFDSNEMPLGFGIAAKSSAAVQRLGPAETVCINQADCGQYLRDEETLFAA